jgi:hypothetical protein
VNDATGEIVPIPCKRNSCPFCSRRNASINAAMLGLDAAERCPTIAATTTTRDAVTAAELRQGFAYMTKLIRGRHADAEYAALIEWTTGRAAKSGGIRRPHFHSLWKGVPADDVTAVRAIAKRVWTNVAGAKSHVVEEIRTPAGAVMYVGRHHLKESQAPPPGFVGLRRIRTSRGYYARPARELRAEAELQVRAGKLRLLLTDATMRELGELLEAGNLEAAQALYERLEEALDERVQAALTGPKPRVVRIQGLDREAA